MESRKEIITKWGISCNFLEYEQLRFRLQNFLRNHIDGTMFIQPCLPFLIQISNLSSKGCTHFYKCIKRANRSILFQIKAKWEESLNDTVNFDQIEICFSLCNKTTECTYLRYIQFKILHYTNMPCQWGQHDGMLPRGRMVFPRAEPEEKPSSWANSRTNPIFNLNKARSQMTGDSHIPS